ncbi:MAG: glycine oxidase ThiO [Planctomycetaceae bacterium]|nr:glycine oxidase ThiO [Planctomycetaceae bacterium]
MAEYRSEILICGGGVVGLTTAYVLAQRGVRVTVADVSATGQEASWAGAGMLPPGFRMNADSAELRIRSYSHSLWPSFVQKLREQTGMDNGYVVCGAIEFPDSHQTCQSLLQSAVNDGVVAEQQLSSQLRPMVPGLGNEWQSGVWLPQFAQVRNPRHLQALRAACVRLGVIIAEHQASLRLERDEQKLVSARSTTDVFRFDRVLVAAGSWSSLVLAELGITIPVKPVRGQIVQLRMDRLPFRCVLEVGRRYLVPRPDGLILIGSTEEDVGFQKANTADGVSSLLDFACSLVPELRQASIVKMWSGLRPYSSDELPLLGQIGDFQNLFIGTGHFRAGLQMSPATGTILADLLTDNEPSISLDGLRADRFL